MSTSRHMNKICVAAIVISIVLSLLFMSGTSLGIVSTGRVMGYENRLFDTSFVHTIEIVMEDWDGFIETCESEEYSPCAVVIDGESYKNIGIRAKGNTSLSSVRSMGSERYSFKLEFDQYENGKSYHGLDKLSLNNLIQDNTMMKDYLTYQLMGDFGVDAPLCSYVYITVNGEDWGLYLAVEGVEDGFLQRNYGPDSGELYKPDSLSFGGGRGNGMEFSFDNFDFDDMDLWNMPQKDSGNGGGGFPAMPGGNMPQGGSMPPGAGGGNGSFGGNFGGDFGGVPGGDFGGSFGGSFGGDFSGGFEGDFGGGFGGMGSDDVKLKYIDDNADSYSNIFDNAKTKITDTDKQRLIAALKSLGGYTDLENTLDTDEVLRYFVVHNFVCNGDSYTGAMIHNYYLHEKDGQLSMIPWDYNLAFGTFQSGDAGSSVNASIDNPVSGGSVDDRPMLGWIFSDEGYTQKYHELFSDFIERWFSDGQLAKLIEETQELLRPFVEKDPTKFCTVEEFDTGVQTLEGFVTLRAEAVGRQLSGDTSVVDTTGLDTSAMGSMGGTMGGGFGGRNDKASEAGNFPAGDRQGSENGGTFQETPGGNQDGSLPGTPGGSRDGSLPGAPDTQPGGMSPWGNTSSGAAGGSSAGTALLLLCISVIVLMIGLLAAVKVKH